MEKWRMHFTELVEKGVLLQRPRGVTATQETFFASYFAVFKDEKETRAIINCRKQINAAMTAPPPVELMSVAEQIKMLAALQPNGVVLADVKNYFYQIRIATSLRRFFALRMAGHDFCCSVLPMGWNWAPACAQALAWGVLLYNVEDLAVEWKSRSLHSGVPGMLEIKQEDTLIFLIYDTFLVACKHARHAAAWEKRLTEAAKRVCLDMKYIEKKQGDFEFSFNGVEYRRAGPGLSWRISQDTLNAWLAFASLDRGAIKDTPRCLYKVVGFLRRAAEIQRSPARNLRLVAKAQALAAKEGIPADGWDSECIDPYPITKGLEMVKSIDNAWCHLTSHWKKRQRGEFMYVAAAFDATPTWWGVVFLSENGDVLRVAHGPTPPDCWENINAAEAYAARQAKGIVRHAALAPIALMLGDNTVALRGHAKGYSTSVAVDKWIEDDIVDSLRWLWVDVPTAENVADTASRATSEEEVVTLVPDRLQATLHRAEEAWRAWRNSPFDFRGRNDVEDAVEEPPWETME